MMSAKPIPEGYHTVTPYLIVKNADMLLQFMKAAFNAQVKEEHRLPDGTIMHADVMIGDSHVMMGQAGGRWREMPGRSIPARERCFWKLTCLILTAACTQGCTPMPHSCCRTPRRRCWCRIMPS